MKKIIAIDQGTTSTRAIIFDQTLNILKIESEKLRSSFPNSGWVEQSPEEITNGVVNTVKALFDEDVVALGITNQRETVVIWDRDSGLPIYNAIVWQDRRTESMCNNLKVLGYENLIRQRTGLLLDPYFSATKISWILENVKNARAKAINGKLAFGTIDTFILWQLSDGKVHATDITNASRTMLFNINTKEWDEDLLEIFDIPKSMLPNVKENISNFAETSLFGKKIPIKVMIGDQQAAAIGQNCVRPGTIKATFGTGCFSLLNTGEQALMSKSNLITTIAYQVNGSTSYAIEGSIFNVGTIIDWLKNNMSFIKNYKDLDDLEEENNDLTFIPAFTGLGAPYWNSSCRGAIFGIERNTTTDQLVLAALKSISFQVRDLLSAIKLDYSNQNITDLKVDGGVSQNDWVMQKVSDQLGMKIIRPKNREASAFGVAFLIGLSLGFFKNLDVISNYSEVDRIFNPKNDKVLIEHDYERWKEAVRKLLN